MLDKFDNERLDKYTQIHERCYKRTINNDGNKQDFINRLHGDLAPFYANEIKLYKIQNQMNQIRNEYIKRFEL